MFTQSFVNKLTREHALALLSERETDAARARRGLPLIDKKMADYPNWKGTCPKSGMPLTLQDIKDELREWLEESEDEIKQLNQHIEKIVPPIKSKATEIKQMTLFD